MKKVSKDKLKDAVNSLKGKLPEDVVVLVGCRKIKNGQLEAEFAQIRALAGRKTSLLAALNEGDKRFNSGQTTMRVWMMVNATGFANVFPGVKDQTGALIDLVKVNELAQTLDADDRVALLAQVKNVMVNGVKQDVKIVAKETVDITELPKSIREQLENDEVEDSIKERYILQTGVNDTNKVSDLIVDKNGNKVYRHYVLSYGDDTDVLVADKMLLSDYSKKPSVNSTANTLAGALNDN